MNTQPKVKPWRSKPYRQWIAKHLCVTCNTKTGIIHAHHEQERMQGGMGTKPGDERCLPLCWKCHNERHDTGRGFWDKYSTNPDLLISLFNKRWLAMGKTIETESA